MILAFVDVQETTRFFFSAQLQHGRHSLGSEKAAGAAVGPALASDGRKGPADALLHVAGRPGYL